jgi:threonine synthase
MSYSSQICKCGGILEVKYKNLAQIPNSKDFWDYEELLPKSNYKRLMLGGTRMIDSYEKNLMLKLELYNPTRSFKDRGSVIEVAKAKEYGYKTLAVASTGNMAYSLSYYSKIYKIKARVFISRSAKSDKIYNILKTHDAVLHKVNGDFSKAQGEAALYASKNKVFLSGDYCYRKEGQKTLAYEIIAQCDDVSRIIVPVGNGTLISGMYKGLCELKAAGNISKFPKLIAVQAEKCSPLAKAFNNGDEIVYEKPHTEADAIAVGMPTYGAQAIEAIRNTNGSVFTITEREMVKMQQKMYEEYGILGELASSAAFAAYYKLNPSEGGKTVAVISGGNV